jgi:hypothetical protein
MTGSEGLGSDIQVLEVQGRALRREFLTLPERLYDGDPAWVPPLLLEQQQRVFRNAPYFAHAAVKAWVARDTRGVVVGRITAQLDNMQPPLEGEAVGYFGMLEAVDEPRVFHALLDAAGSWLREQGAAWIRGPYNLSINEEVGLLVENYQDPPYFLMGHARPYYGARLEEAGFQGVRDLLTYTVAPDFRAPPVMSKLAHRAEREVRVRPMNRANKGADLESLRDIFNDAWSQNWGFVPFTRAEFAEVARMLTLLLDNDCIQIAEYRERPVAFIVALPNINEAIRDLNGRLLPFGWLKLLWRLKVRRPRSARVALMGVRKEFQFSRLGPTLAFMVIDAVRGPLTAQGVREVELGWILEDNAGMRHIIEELGSQVYKRYRVYHKRL